MTPTQELCRPACNHSQVHFKAEPGQSCSNVPANRGAHMQGRNPPGDKPFRPFMIVSIRYPFDAPV